MCNKIRSNNGFTLVEVMLAVLVLGVGILAVSKLQTSLLRSGGDANQRAVAASVAQKKIDDLRRFSHITSGGYGTWDGLNVNSVTSLKYPLSLAFEHIGDNKGGRIKAGAYSVGSNINYNLSWYSDSYYYSGLNSVATTTAVTTYPAFKTVHVLVRWNGLGDNTNNVVSFDTVIDAYNLAFTDLGSNPSSGGSAPIVQYTPQSAPDVVPITIDNDGVKKETSKPLPDVSKKGDSTLVKFESVTYNPSLDTVRREEFRTLACNCTSSGASPNSEQIYGLVTWDDIDMQIVDVTTTRTMTINKTKVDNSGGEDQDDACTVCCRDGKDVITTGNSTFKVCRLKRIDGILRLMDPWKLIGFNIIPASYFNDSDGLGTMTTTLQEANIDLYSSYVTTLVRNVLAATGSVTGLNNYSTVDTSFVNYTSSFTNPVSIDHLAFNVGSTNNREFQVRGVYMDYPPSGIFTTEMIAPTTTITYTATNVPLDRVPFYEVNLTQLAGWIPDVSVLRSGANTGDQIFYTNTAYTEAHDNMDTSACVNTANPSAGRNYVTNEEFFYSGGTTTTCNNASRGDFHPIVTGTTTISSKVFTNSDGVVDRNINSSNPSVEISLEATVN